MLTMLTTLFSTATMVTMPRGGVIRRVIVFLSACICGLAVWNLILYRVVTNKLCVAGKRASVWQSTQCRCADHPSEIEASVASINTHTHTPLPPRICSRTRYYASTDACSCDVMTLSHSKGRLRGALSVIVIRRPADNLLRT